MHFDDIIKQMPILFGQLQSSDFIERQNARCLPVSGVYVFYENSQPVYVGRSRNIIARIQSHSRPSSGHNSASFAFLLAKERAQQMGLNTRTNRGDLERDPSFAKIYTEEKERVAKMKIKAAQVDDPEVQAIFEIYASKILKTKYNDFDTH